MNETQEIETYMRKKKGGKRKCVEVQGYARKKPRQISEEKGTDKDD